MARGRPPCIAINSAPVFRTAARKRVSGYGVRVGPADAWDGFRRQCLSQHSTQGRVAQRLAQRPVGPEAFRDLGQVVLLPTSRSASGPRAAASLRAWERFFNGSVSYSGTVASPEPDTSVAPSWLKASDQMKLV
jgi:hypothetical protein